MRAQFPPTALGGLSGITYGVINQIRSEKKHMIDQTGRFWSYDDLLLAMLQHWQAASPAELPVRAGQRSYLMEQSA